MFSRRRSDTTTETDRGRFEKLKRVTTTLLESFRSFSIGSTPAETEQVRRQIDEHIARLADANSIEALEGLELSLKRVIVGHRESEQVRTAVRTEALRKLNEATADRVQQLAGDSEDFAVQLSSHLKALAEHAVTDEADQLRQHIDAEIPTLSKLLEHRQENEQRIVGDLRAQVDALEKQLHKANEELVIDPLTQVYNRRAFDSRLQESVRDHHRNGTDFSLVMFDIDHFKKVNDTHGHLVGDRVLQALAQTAKKVFRLDDFVARYGGEEFAAILYGANVTYGLRAAERFRLAIAGKEFEYRRRSKVYTLKLTVSLGIACHKPGDSPESLIERADKALYLAKNSGRNQVKTEEDLRS